jgi:16S rRNA (cytosine967-C5)-methyltransferase
VPLAGPDGHWLDLCAGPGGKAALLAALAAERGATLTANELRPHRAELVRRVTEPWSVEVHVGDARTFAGRAGGYDRVLLDAPCTGLGALRRRPEARWRRRPEDVGELVALQRELLDAALRLTRPGGVAAYVTCSPHPAETVEIVAGRDLLDVRPAFPGVDQLGDGPTVQLWPHRHGTDAMFCAVVRRS